MSSHILPLFNNNTPPSTSTSASTTFAIESEPEKQPSPRIEDYRAGYPRYSALISSTDSFFVFRRFKRLRARLLLLKQDRLSALEEKLDHIDRDEAAALFLGQSRFDGNKERKLVTSEIEAGLADYDKFADDTNRMLKYEKAQDRSVSSLQNWIDGTGSIAIEETDYLLHDRDLFTLAPAVDNAMVRFEAWVEDRLIQSFPNFRDLKLHDISTDRNVYIYSGTIIGRTAKALLIALITILLLLPIVICNVIDLRAIRIVVIMISTVVYLLVLSGLTKAKTTELVVAATTYATVLIVFVSGTAD